MEPSDNFRLPATTARAEPFRLALFGAPVRHSLSPQIHQHFAGQFDLTVDYALHQPDEKQLPLVLAEFFQHGGHGANITVPYKQAVAQWADELAESASQSLAVNTLVRHADGQLVGHNTDGAGLLRDLTGRHGLSLNNKRILVIGAGGATRGVVPALLHARPAQVVVANRGQQRLRGMRRLFPQIETVALDQLAYLPAFDLIIHATSLGHHGLSPDLPRNLFQAGTVAYDLSYGQAAKPFLRAAQVAGASQGMDGLGMLVEQAALAFSLWFGRKPETEIIYQQLRAAGSGF